MRKGMDTETGATLETDYVSEGFPETDESTEEQRPQVDKQSPAPSADRTAGLRCGSDHP